MMFLFYWSLSVYLLLTINHAHQWLRKKCVRSLSSCVAGQLKESRQERSFGVCEEDKQRTELALRGSDSGLTRERKLSKSRTTAENLTDFKIIPGPAWVWEYFHKKQALSGSVAPLAEYLSCYQVKTKTQIPWLKSCWKKDPVFYDSATGANQ